MSKVKLPATSGADSFLAEIRERQQAKEKRATHTEIAIEEKPEELEMPSAPKQAEKVASRKSVKKAENGNRLVIPRPEKKEAKGVTMTFRMTSSLKKKFQEKCEQEGVSQNYILEQLIDIWVKMEE